MGEDSVVDQRINEFLQENLGWKRESRIMQSEFCGIARAKRTTREKQENSRENQWHKIA